jgi:hydrogenase maturation protein HypF
MWISRSEAEAGLGLIADGVLLHDRAIVRPLDDSVAQVIDGRPRLLRRARGYVPEPIRMVSGVVLSGGEPSAVESLASGPSAAEPPGVDRSSPTVILALGADLKSAPALAIGERLWMAAPFGSLDHHANAVRFEAAVREVLKGHPEAGAGIVCEAHPGSRSSELAQRLGRRCQPVAHHQAHGLAVLAEHGLATAGARVDRMRGLFA